MERLEEGGRRRGKEEDGKRARARTSKNTHGLPHTDLTRTHTLQNSTQADRIEPRTKEISRRAAFPAVTTLVHTPPTSTSDALHT